MRTSVCSAPRQRALSSRTCTVFSEFITNPASTRAAPECLQTLPGLPESGAQARAYAGEACNNAMPDTGACDHAAGAARRQQKIARRPPVFVLAVVGLHARGGGFFLESHARSSTGTSVSAIVSFSESSGPSATACAHPPSSRRAVHQIEQARERSSGPGIGASRCRRWREPCPRASV